MIKLFKLIKRKSQNQDHLQTLITFKYMKNFKTIIFIFLIWILNCLPSQAGVSKKNALKLVTEYSDYLSESQFSEGFIRPELITTFLTGSPTFLTLADQSSLPKSNLSKVLSQLALENDQARLIPIRNNLLQSLNNLSPHTFSLLVNSIRFNEELIRSNELRYLVMELMEYYSISLKEYNNLAKSEGMGKRQTITKIQIDHLESERKLIEKTLSTLSDKESKNKSKAIENFWNKLPISHFNETPQNHQLNKYEQIIDKINFETNNLFSREFLKIKINLDKSRNLKKNLFLQGETLDIPTFLEVKNKSKFKNATLLFSKKRFDGINKELKVLKNALKKEEELTHAIKPLDDAKTNFQINPLTAINKLDVSSFTEAEEISRFIGMGLFLTKDDFQSLSLSILETSLNQAKDTIRKHQEFLKRPTFPEEGKALGKLFITDKHYLAHGLLIARVSNLYGLELKRRALVREQQKEITKSPRQPLENKVNSRTSEITLPLAKPSTQEISVVSVVKETLSSSSEENPFPQKQESKLDRSERILDKTLSQQNTPFQKTPPLPINPQDTLETEIIWNVSIKKSVTKEVNSLLSDRQKLKFDELVSILERNGPILVPSTALEKGLRNFSKLTPTDYHCHLGSSDRVAVWKVLKDSNTIVIYYLGRHPNSYKRIVQ